MSHASLVYFKAVGLVAVVGLIGWWLFRDEDELKDEQEFPGLHKREFIPTRNWQVVDPDHICPAGLEYQMDLSTGQSLARLPEA